VLTVIEPSYRDNTDQSDWLEQCDPEDRAAAMSAYQSSARALSDMDARIEHEIRVGPLGETIVTVARENGSDLVVLGSRGRSALSRMLLGSTSDHVATHADCSVLVVRPDAGAGIGHPLRVAIAYQDSQAVHDGLVEFNRIDWGEETEVDIISVTEFVEGFSRRKSDSNASKRLASSIRDAVKAIRKSSPRARSRFLENEHVGEGIVCFLEKQNTNLVLVAETPKGAIGRLMLGSVSWFVLRHAPCSVWITRN
jgi:nucleotide-binding universal stress UspA family protein